VFQQSFPAESVFDGAASEAMIETVINEINPSD